MPSAVGGNGGREGTDGSIAASLLLSAAFEVLASITVAALPWVLFWWRVTSNARVEA